VTIPVELKGDRKVEKSPIVIPSSLFQSRSPLCGGFENSRILHKVLG
jgi:hypothetical protein